MSRNRWADRSKPYARGGSHDVRRTAAIAFLGAFSELFIEHQRGSAVTVAGLTAELETLLRARSFPELLTPGGPEARSRAE